MYRFIATLILFTVCTSGFYTQSHQEFRSLNQHLSEVNSLWQDSDIEFNTQMSFDSDEARIRKHLELVVAHLMEVPVTGKSGQRRINLLRALHEYSQKMQFPVNEESSERTPCFIDSYGTACAVGHMIIKSGNADLALRISKQYNRNYLKDIHTDGLMDWAKLNGFSLKELAWIQPTYFPPNSLANVGSGVNGPVRKLYSNSGWGRMYIIGEYDLMDGSVDCPNGFGYFENSSYYCVEGSPEGEYLDVTLSASWPTASTTETYIAGQFENNNELFPLAMNDGNSWHYFTLPDRPNAKGIKVLGHYSESSKLQLAIDPSDGTGNHEVWSLSIENDSTWTKVATTHGPIFCMNDTHVGGDFSSYVDHLDNDVTVASDGAFGLYLTMSSPSISPLLSAHLPAQVRDIKIVGNVIYFAGTSDGVYPSTILSSLLNNTFQPLYTLEDSSTYSGAPSTGFYDLEVHSDGDLYIAGDVDLGNIFGNYGRGLGRYDGTSAFIYPEAYVDSAVYSIAKFNQDIYLGGSFTQNIFNPISNPARLDMAPNTLEEIESSKLSVYPSPADVVINIQSDYTSSIELLEIVDLNGQLISSHEQPINSIDVSRLESGTYLIKVYWSDGFLSKPFLKL